jgi:hypothetical protein
MIVLAYGMVRDVVMKSFVDDDTRVVPGLARGFLHADVFPHNLVRAEVHDTSRDLQLLISAQSKAIISLISMLNTEADTHVQPRVISGYFH